MRRRYPFLPDSDRSRELLTRGTYLKMVLSQESEMSEIRVDALEAAVREFNLSLPAWAPFKRWGDLTLQERDQCLTRAVEILRAINVLKKWVAA